MILVIQNVAFIGVGVMGFHMAKHLLENGYQVTVFNRSQENVDRLVALGAKRAPTLREVAAEADIVFTMLPTEKVVHSVLLGEGGAIEGAKPGCIFANSSTVSPQSNVLLNQELTARGFRFVEDPVTGSGLQAQAGTLVFIYAGDKELFEAIKPLYLAMGKDAFYGGPKIGSASYAKIASNAMMAMNMLSFAESVIMAYKAGVDPEMFVKFCAGGGPGSRMADLKVGKIINRDFSATFRTALMYKDTGLAANLAKDLEIPTPMLSLAKELYNIACIEGHQDEDLCSVVRCYEDWAKVTIQKESAD